MGSRGIAVFFIVFLLIRISGRRSFGIHKPLDNIISILLGAILSRAVVGASSFIPVMITCFVIVIMHRIVCWFISHLEGFGKSVNGKKIVLYEEGRLIKENLRKALISEDDMMQGVRKSALTEDLLKLPGYIWNQMEKLLQLKNSLRPHYLRTLSGSMIPIVLKQDPATSSAPFVATLVDVTGLVI